MRERIRKYVIGRAANLHLGLLNSGDIARMGLTGVMMEGRLPGWERIRNQKNKTKEKMSGR